MYGDVNEWARELSKEGKGMNEAVGVQQVAVIERCWRWLRKRSSTARQRAETPNRQNKEKELKLPDTTNAMKVFWAISVHSELGKQVKAFVIVDWITLCVISHFSGLYRVVPCWIWPKNQNTVKCSYHAVPWLGKKLQGLWIGKSSVISSLYDFSRKGKQVEQSGGRRLSVWMRREIQISSSVQRLYEVLAPFPPQNWTLWVSSQKVYHCSGDGTMLGKHLRD